MLAEDDNRMQSTASRPGHRDQASCLVQNPHGRGLAKRRNPRMFKVFGPNRVAVRHTPEPRRIDRYGRQVGERIGRRNHTRRDFSTKPFGRRERNRRLD